MKKDPELMKIIEPVQDPELMMSIVELGLIYGVERVGDDIKCEMTFTSIACPMGPQIKAAVETALKDGVKDAKNVDVQIVFNPPWDPKEHCSEDAKMKLGIF